MYANAQWAEKYLHLHLDWCCQTHSGLPFDLIYLRMYADLPPGYLASTLSAQLRETHSQLTLITIPKWQSGVGKKTNNPANHVADKKISTQPPKGKTS